MVLRNKVIQENIAISSTTIEQARQIMAKENARLEDARIANLQEAITTILSELPKEDKQDAIKTARRLVRVSDVKNKYGSFDKGVKMEDGRLVERCYMYRYHNDFLEMVDLKTGNLRFKSMKFKQVFIPKFGLDVHNFLTDWNCKNIVSKTKAKHSLEATSKQVFERLRKKQVEKSVESVDGDEKVTLKSICEIDESAKLKKILSEKICEIKEINEKFGYLRKFIKTNLERYPDLNMKSTELKDLVAENQILIFENQNLKSEIMKIKKLYETKNGSETINKESKWEIKFKVISKDLSKIREEIGKRDAAMKALTIQNNFLRKAIRAGNNSISKYETVSDSTGFESKSISESFLVINANSADGSSGYHNERRENGRFGSLPTFDNHGDEYNEKFDDDEFDLY